MNLKKCKKEFMGVFGGKGKAGMAMKRHHDKGNFY